MGRIIGGALLTIWGVLAGIYGLTREPEGNGAYRAGQMAAVVVAACMTLGGLSLVVSGIKRESRGPSSRGGRGGWGDGSRHGRSAPDGDVSITIVLMVLGGVGLLVLFVVTAFYAARSKKKPAADQVNTVRPNDDWNGGPQPGGAFPPVVPGPAQPQVPVLKPGIRQTQPAGGAFANLDYREYRDDGALLVGFEVGFGKVFNTTIIAYLRPIWRTNNGGEECGTAYGKSQTETIVLKARDGYAVGGIVIAGGGALEGFALTFMRIGDKHLDKNDAYTSDWYGDHTRRPRDDQMAAGDGSFVVGFYGKRFNDKRGDNYDDGGAVATIGFYLWVKE
jgi:hypothetical protein